MDGYISRVDAFVLFVLLIAFDVHLGRVRELVQQDVLAAAEAKLDDVLLLELVVALRLDALVVQVGAVAGGQVDDVRPHPAAHRAVGARELHQSGDTGTGESGRWRHFKFNSAFKPVFATEANSVGQSHSS